MTGPLVSDSRLDRLQQESFAYFRDCSDPRTGLTADHSGPGAPCSITAAGFGLACLTLGAARGWMDRSEAARRVARTLRTFEAGEQSESRDAMGWHGFYYHFLDPRTGRRARRCELSTIDTTFLLAGALAAGAWFDGADPIERDIRSLSDTLYRRADWTWAQAGGITVRHGWSPERGFLRARWSGYNEAILLYVLGLGSPTFPLPAACWAAWTSTYRWKRLYGLDVLYGGPLFVHQLSHVWLDFRGIRDAWMRDHGLDYFENSRRATFIQRRYATRNPRRFAGYGPDVWGITASDGPGPAVLEIDGVRRRFYDYVARGAPWGIDDGTLSPWAVVASLPFAPDEVRAAIARIEEEYPDVTDTYGFKCSFNPTFRNGRRDGDGWISRRYYGLDQGPVVLMIENARSGFLWKLMAGCPAIVLGLRRAGFRGAWLDRAA